MFLLTISPPPSIVRPTGHLGTQGRQPLLLIVQIIVTLTMSGKHRGYRVIVMDTGRVSPRYARHNPTRYHVTSRGCSGYDQRSGTILIIPKYVGTACNISHPDMRDWTETISYSRKTIIKIGSPHSRHDGGAARGFLDLT